MTSLCVEVETCSERYKKYIRSAEYGDTVSETTNENMIFLFDNKKYTIKFTLDFSFDFENGFNYTNFSDFKSSRNAKSDILNEFIKHIKNNFVTSDRLSR